MTFAKSLLLSKTTRVTSCGTTSKKQVVVYELIQILLCRQGDWLRHCPRGDRAKQNL
ncbi:hypothetical protein [Scytonema sp. PRP1]|uniref:hypothetical protein n=1 Tax=Scytonema sp. PRP1 TaxID=3120513 RepID=UPI00300D9E52